MELIALDSFTDSTIGTVRGGQPFTTSTHMGNLLIGKGLAKMAPGYANKMRSGPENKARPTETDGATGRSSASPAVPVSPQTTASVSEPGTPKRKRKPKAELLS